MPEKIVMTAEDIRRTLARIAHEIIERNKGTSELVLVDLFPEFSRAQAEDILHAVPFGSPVSSSEASRMVTLS